MNGLQLDSRFRGNDGAGGDSMTAKMCDKRKAAFLRALGACGNQAVAAEKACVSRSWVCLQRRRDAAFDAECRAAIERAQEGLAGHGERRPPRGWGHLDGVELVVKGTGGTGGGRRVQIARARVRQITPRVEQRLLQVLGATCNGDAACAEVGVSTSAVWAHRKRWPAFEAKWQSAIEDAYVRLEFGLIENAENLFSPTEFPPELPMPPMTCAQVIHILHMHKHQVLGIGKAPGRKWRPPPTLAELAPGIWRKFRAFEAWNKLSAGARARAKAQWARRRGGAEG